MVLRQIRYSVFGDILNIGLSNGNLNKLAIAKGSLLSNLLSHVEEPKQHPCDIKFIVSIKDDSSFLN